MSAGRIIKSGDKSLALELESRGYDWLLDDKKATKKAAA
jgi:Fe-S cluster assembly ATP-binding protein